MNTKYLSAVDINSCHLITNNDKPFILVLKKGAELIESIITCATASNLYSASLSGLGALESPKLGCYNFAIKQYKYKIFPGIYELIALNGNITKHEDKYVTHIHVVLGNDKYNVIAGHLDCALVGITAEITIVPFNSPITRKYNPDFNVNLIDTSNS